MVTSPAMTVMGKPTTIIFIKGAALERRPKERLTKKRTAIIGMAMDKAVANILQKSSITDVEIILVCEIERQETDLNELMRLYKVVWGPLIVTKISKPNNPVNCPITG